MPAIVRASGVNESIGSLHPCRARRYRAEPMDSATGGRVPRRHRRRGSAYLDVCPKRHSAICPQMRGCRLTGSQPVPSLAACACHHNHREYSLVDRSNMDTCKRNGLSVRITQGRPMRLRADNSQAMPEGCRAMLADSEVPRGGALEWILSTGSQSRAPGSNDDHRRQGQGRDGSAGPFRAARTNP
jgi:hypothetical protein